MPTTKSRVIEGISQLQLDVSAKELFFHALQIFKKADARLLALS